MGIAPDQLREKALAAVEEAADRARAAPIERTKALGFALAYLWCCAGGDRTPFVMLWTAMGIQHEITRSQNVNAAYNSVRRALGYPPV